MHGLERARAESSRLRAVPVRGAVRSRIGNWICAWLVALFALASHAQTPPGTLIANTAQGAFTPSGGTPAVVNSNTDAITTGAARTPSTTSIFHYAPGALGAFARLPAAHPARQRGRSRPRRIRATRRAHRSISQLRSSCSQAAPITKAKRSSCA
jgi:hypothetical protein